MRVNQESFGVRFGNVDVVKRFLCFQNGLYFHLPPCRGGHTIGRLSVGLPPVSRRKEEVHSDLHGLHPFLNLRERRDKLERII